MNKMTIFSYYFSCLALKKADTKVTTKISELQLTVGGHEFEVVSDTHELNALLWFTCYANEYVLFLLAPCATILPSCNNLYR